MNEYDSKRIFDMAKKLIIQKQKILMKQIVMFLTLVILEKKQQKKFIMMSVELKKSLGIKKNQ